MAEPLKRIVGWTLGLVTLTCGIIWLAAFLIPSRTRAPLGEPQHAEAPRWYPQVGTVPSNHLKFYLVSPAPLTQGDIFAHLELRDDTTSTPISGAFRETELWSPDSKRFTLWLHPGRQKTGVNLNEDEGPVLIEGHHYTLRLSKNATTTTGSPLPADITLRFQAGPADHTPPDPKRWIIHAPRAATRQPLIIRFDEPLDHAMLPAALELQGGMAADDIFINTTGTAWQFTPRSPWTTGTLFLSINTNLEDLAGNNLLGPFETDTARPQKGTEPVKAMLSFQVN